MLLEIAPFLNINSPAFPIVISCAAIFATVYINNRKIKIDMRKDNDSKLDEKADLNYVKEKNLEYDNKIIAINAAIETMGTSNSSQHKNLFTKIEEVGKGVARIEGYLEAMKEKPN